MKDIFLSYASKDKKQATIFVEALEKEGWTIWWDQTLLAGEDYEKKITKELQSSRGVIVLLSNNSVESPWVKAEYAYALDRYKKPLVPVLLEDLKLPIRLYGLNAVDLTNWNERTDYQEFKRLLKSLLAVIGQPLPPSHSEQEEKPESEDQEPSHNESEHLVDDSPLPNITGLPQFIFLPFGIPTAILLLSHLLIKVFG